MQDTQGTLEAEVHVLDRLMDMLEEGSVSFLTKEDPKFANYIQEIYSSLYSKSSVLRTKVYE
jgi:hypothetical protein